MSNTEDRSWRDQVEQDGRERWDRKDDTGKLRGSRQNERYSDRRDERREYEKKDSYDRRNERNDYGRRGDRTYRERRHNDRDYERKYEYRDHDRNRNRIDYNKRDEHREYQRRDERRNRSYRESNASEIKRDPSPLPEPEKPCYIPTGLLAKAQNTVKLSNNSSTALITKPKADSDSNTDTKQEPEPEHEIVLKYHEPLDAAPFAPKIDRRRDETRGLHGTRRTVRLVGPAIVALDRRTYYLVGSEPAICDILLASSANVDPQHAVIQYRVRERGRGEKWIAPYIMDLESHSGTILNGEKIPEARFVELKNGDVLKWGEVEFVFIIEK